MYAKLPLEIHRRGICGIWRREVEPCGGAETGGGEGAE